MPITPTGGQSSAALSPVAPVITTETWDDLEALLQAARAASTKGDAVECRRLLRRIKSQAQSMLAMERMKTRPPRYTKLERCKDWLVALIGTVARPVKEVLRTAYLELDCEERTVQTALKELGAVRSATGKGRKRVWSVGLPEVYRKNAKTLASSGNNASKRSAPEVAAPIQAKPGTDKRLTEMKNRAKAGLPIITGKDADLDDKEGLDILRRLDRRTNRR